MIFEPLGNRVLILRNEIKKESAGGIVLPGKVAEKDESRGRVLGVGDEVKYLKVGDLVIFGAFTGINISTDGKHYVIMEEKEIVARYTGE